MITEQYIMERLREYAKTPEGTAQVEGLYKRQAENGTFRGKGIRAQVKSYLAEIASKLYEAISETIPSFSRSRDSIHATIQKSDDSGIAAQITIDEDALHRESLHYMNRQTYANTSKLKISAGSGVYDIVGLFAHGYSIKGRRPYGFWVHAGGESEERVGARMKRDPDPFLERLVERLNTDYGDICEITLNEKYKH